MDTKQIIEKTEALIDALRATCSAYGLSGDSSEYKIIVQVFLYKFLNDKFGYEIKIGHGSSLNPIKKRSGKNPERFLSFLMFETYFSLNGGGVFPPPPATFSNSSIERTFGSLFSSFCFITLNF